MKQITCRDKLLNGTRFSGVQMLNRLAFRNIRNALVHTYYFRNKSDVENK